MCLIKYRCSSIKELLTAFNLDIQLSDKLLSHEIVSDFGLVFDQHYIQEGKFGSYHVFQGYFTEMIFDAFPPIIYIDSVSDVVYFRYYGKLGLYLYKYDSNDKESILLESNLELYDEYNLEKLLSII